MIPSNRKSAYTLIELAIVLVIFAIIAAVSLPRLKAARLVANEAAAIASLKAIWSAEVECQTASWINTDSDAIGEFGFISELRGDVPPRVRVSWDGQVGRGNEADKFNPPFLHSSFPVGRWGIRERSGYLFEVWLPTSESSGISEQQLTVNWCLSLINPDESELHWRCYAWPVEAGTTGRRCFYIDERGRVLVFGNEGGMFSNRYRYSGIRTPTFETVDAWPFLK